MADNDKRKFDLPWGTLLPLLAVLAGVVAQYKPLVTERPSVPSEKSAPVIAAQDVDARLWQDPIGVAQKQKSLLDEQIEKGLAKTGVTESHDICALSDLFYERAGEFPGHILLLAVMLDAGPYSEQAESRLRTRQAVLEGLSESGFAPVDGEHIGFVTANWPPQMDNAPAACAPSPPIDRALLLPWEECEAIDAPKNVFPHGTKRVVVVWLPAANFNPYPLRYFGALIDQLAPAEIRDRIEVKLIGPANSTGLQNMVREMRWCAFCLSSTMKDELGGVSIISPRATASDRTLLSAADNPVPKPEGISDITLLSPADRPPPYKTVKAFLEQESKQFGLRGGLQFDRTIAPDDWVFDELILELERRDIYGGSETSPIHRPSHPKRPHIVILSEWDTPYGRSLRATFWDKLEQRARIRGYQYLRGIDGRLPGDLGKDNQREQEQKTQLGQNTVVIETTEGLNQSDYLRRLARQMKEDNSRWKREDGFGIRAIGLLGSDIYDKLMILRALRPQFPDAVFFTNNYDAHFERRDDWGYTHNLVIASPFGSTLPKIYVKQRGNIPPFRDNNQTSTYIGTLVATSKLDPDDAAWLSWQPRIFEIGRRGTYDLSAPWYRWNAGESKIVFESRLRQRWFGDWLFTHHVIWALIIIALTVLAIAAWISVSIARRTLRGGGTTMSVSKGRSSARPFGWSVAGRSSFSWLRWLRNAGHLKNRWHFFPASASGQLKCCG
jgi:hypothetical protein